MPNAGTRVIHFIPVLFVEHRPQKVIFHQRSAKSSYKAFYLGRKSPQQETPL